MEFSAVDMVLCMCAARVFFGLGWNSVLRMMDVGSILEGGAKDCILPFVSLEFVASCSLMSSPKVVSRHPSPMLIVSLELVAYSFAVVEVEMLTLEIRSQWRTISMNCLHSSVDHIALHRPKEM